jgi:hypothetical protein
MESAALMLLALAAGYWVLTISQSQQKPLDKLGRLVGGFILLVSIVGLVAGAICRVGCMRGTCSASRMHCPMSASAPAPADAPAQ